MFRVLPAVLLIAACSGPAAPSHAPARADHGSPAALVADAHAVCRTMLPERRIIGWEETTVGALRGYRYGGPTAHHPLGSDFPGLPRSGPAAWCWIRDAPVTGSLWGAVPGFGARRAVTITGPGEGSMRGALSTPPLVP